MEIYVHLNMLGKRGKLWVSKEKKNVTPPPQISHFKITSVNILVYLFSDFFLCIQMHVIIEKHTSEIVGEKRNFLVSNYRSVLSYLIMQYSVCKWNIHSFYGSI